LLRVILIYEDDGQKKLKEPYEKLKDFDPEFLE
jgi:hypothetical protein